MSNHLTSFEDRFSVAYPIKSSIPAPNQPAVLTGFIERVMEHSAPTSNMGVFFE